MKISIEGVPGSGKTTILKILEKMGYNCYMDGEHKSDDKTQKVSKDLDRIEFRLVESSPYVLKRLLSHVSFSFPSVNKKGTAFLLADWTPEFIILLDCQPDISVKRLGKISIQKQVALQVAAPTAGATHLRVVNSKQVVQGVVDVGVEEGKQPRGLLEIRQVIKDTDDNETALSALNITELYVQLEWILHPVNCDIPVFRVNASGTVLHTLHNVLAVLNTILSIQ